ncbi:hypothetical protein CPU12_11515 [Malaciobacter molluscorum LMG 25693]|uniref:Acyltransferase n=1 Tax=Malaciobacter molluscorum LMG 25693 TaxID=870501 RepID=A0A2G1DFI9_9BACT|nr:acyltransferase family protein [Malaciobacter molluscorum]AXX91782.1 putative acyltransferase [Malaciobacter molluscorum LMG 25693]PHO17224.1 hypothetical protein CPU12_11515 [Malaciobacter molluscorum LMG 25693]
MYLKRLDEIRGVALLLLLFAQWLTFYKSDNTLFLVSLTFFTILFFSTLENKRNSISLFSYLGTISYSLYIIHRPILLMYREYFKTDIISHIFVFFIIILCGIFVYKYIEKPFHLLARKYK